MADPVHPHIVVGGGISGLSAAHYAARAGLDTLLLERSERVGGCIQTHPFPQLDQFWIEAGSHSCFNSYGNLLEIMERLHLLGRVRGKAKQSYALWRGGKRSSVFSALHLPELIVSLPRLFAQSKADSSVVEYYGRGLGKRNYRDLLGPAFRSVICQPADEFPADALFRKKPRRKDVLRSFTMPNGLAEIPNAIAAGPGICLESGCTATSVARDGDEFVVQLADGGERRCQHLTLAVPPDIAAQLLEETAPKATAAIRRIGVAEIDSLLLVFRKADLRVPEIAGLISVDGPFLSAVSRDFLPDPRYRGFAFHYPGGQLTEQQRIEAACAALDASPGKAIAISHAKNRLPSLRKGHRSLIDQLDRELAGGKLAITGNWFLGVSIEDCVTRSRSEHERMFGRL